MQIIFSSVWVWTGKAEHSIQLDITNMEREREELSPVLYTCHKSNTTMSVKRDVKEVCPAHFHTDFPHEIRSNKIKYNSFWHCLRCNIF